MHSMCELTFEKRIEYSGTIFIFQFQHIEFQINPFPIWGFNNRVSSLWLTYYRTVYDVFTWVTM